MNKTDLDRCQEILDIIKIGFAERIIRCNEEGKDAGEIEEYAVSFSKAIFEEFNIDEWNYRKQQNKDLPAI